MCLPQRQDFVKHNVYHSVSFTDTNLHLDVIVAEAAPQNIF